MSQTATKEVITGNELAGYVIYRGGFSYDFTQPTVGKLYDYLLAANGLFVHARRPEMNVCFQLSEFEVRGLAPIETWTNQLFPKVPAAYVKKMVDMSIASCVDRAAPIETLFYLQWNTAASRWQLDKPAQKATGTSVKPVDDGPESSYARALIELHSHHQMPAFFSGTDDSDEQGFRIYAVIGEIFTEPKIRVRIGCFGNFFELRAETIFELPASIIDVHEEGSEIVETR